MPPRPDVARASQESVHDWALAKPALTNTLRTKTSTRLKCYAGAVCDSARNHTKRSNKTSVRQNAVDTASGAASLPHTVRTRPATLCGFGPPPCACDDAADGNNAYDDSKLQARFDEARRYANAAPGTASG